MILAVSSTDKKGCRSSVLKSVDPLHFDSGRRPSSYFSVPYFSVHFYVAGPTTVRRTVDRKIKGQKNESLESCSSLVQAPIFLPLHSFAIRLVAAEGRAGSLVAPIFSRTKLEPQ